MMKLRLNFLLPDVEAANQAFDALLLSRIQDKNISFLANKTTLLGRLQPTNAFEGTNTLYEGVHGLLYGAMFGLIAGLFPLLIPLWITDSPAWYTHSPWWVVLLITTTVGAITVGIGAALLGVNVFNSDLQKFKNKIANGSILMIVSAPYWQVKAIQRTMRHLQVNP
jgi:hypothetical protein